MDIRNSALEDLSKIFDLYQMAREIMKSKNQVIWPKFEEELIVKEIEEKRQWKLLIDEEVACIWATTLDDALIWGAANDDPSVYIHRITTHPDFRGRKLVNEIVKWADNFCLENNLKYIRLDTVGLNRGLIDHYTKLGFEFLGAQELENTEGLPQHYSEGPVCLFQRSPMNS